MPFINFMKKYYPSITPESGWEYSIAQAAWDEAYEEGRDAGREDGYFSNIDRADT